MTSSRLTPVLGGKPPFLKSSEAIVWLDEKTGEKRGRGFRSKLGYPKDVSLDTCPRCQKITDILHRARGHCSHCDWAPPFFTMSEVRTSDESGFLTFGDAPEDTPLVLANAENDK